MYQATFRIPAEKEESFSDSLFAAGAESVSVSPAHDAAEVYVHAIVRDIRFLDADFGGAISITRLEEYEWRDRWLRHYDGHEVNDEIYIYPVTSSAPLRDEYRYVLRLDPRDAFGDGRHPTTTMCLTMLHEMLSPLKKEELRARSMLDIGSGTGILAIGASLMGVGEIHAIDCDDASVAMTRKNAALNNANNITCTVSDIGMFSPGRTFDIVTANLLTGILQEHFSEILSLLNPAGTLILSGISTRWGKEMDALFNERNAAVKKKETLEEWLAYLLQPAG